MNIWDEIIKAGELQKLKKEAKADIIPVLKVLLDTDTVRMKDVIELCDRNSLEPFVFQSFNDSYISSQTRS